MAEKMTFQASGLIKDKTSLQEIEFWGHDAGEFTLEEIEEVWLAMEKTEEKEGSGTD